MLLAGHYYTKELSLIQTRTQQWNRLFFLAPVVVVFSLFYFICLSVLVTDHVRRMDKCVVERVKELHVCGVVECCNVL